MLLEWGLRKAFNRKDRKEGANDAKKIKNYLVGLARVGTIIANLRQGN